MTLERKLSISSLIALVVLATGGLMAFTDVRARVSVIEASRVERAQDQKDRDDAQDRELREKFGLIQDQMKALNEKMDKVVDKVSAAK